MIGSADELFCAVSTPSGTSGIAVIRISGNGAAKSIDRSVKIIRSSGGYGKVSELPGYTCCFADLRDPDTGVSVDKVVITRFEAPFSYTGDEMVEISCHGSPEVKKEILDILYRLGIRAAGPGEFTKTAFMNGKMSLSSAEAVMDIIASDSSEELRAANVISEGALSRKTDKIENDLYEMMAMIEMVVDFDDDDSPDDDTRVKVSEILNGSIKDLENIVASYRKGRMLSEKMKVSFTGIPNSGKSTLLNSIAGYDRSIVTDISGTTTDTIEAVCDIYGVPVVLTDTAGITKSSDRIESLGVERAIREYGKSDIVFYLVSPDTTVKQASDQLHDVRAKIREDAELIVLFNKSDIGTNPGEEEIREIGRRYGATKFISISASDGTNVEEVRRAIKAHYDDAGVSDGGLVITNRRHYETLDGALEILRTALTALDKGEGLDVVSSIVRAALDKTGEISGKTVSADLAKTIFDRFCIGK